MDIPGLKNIRLLAQQPAGLMVRGGMNLDLPKQYFMELELEKGAVINIPISKQVHDDYVRLMAQQGTAIEQRVSARPGMAKPGETAPPYENYIPVNATTKEAEEALRDSVERSGSNYVTGGSPLLDGEDTDEEESH